MTEFATLATQPIAMGMGQPLGYSNWRYVVQLAKAPSSGVLGNFILGTDKLGALAWVDVTTDCQGVSWTTGGAPGDRPIAGELRLRLENHDRRWSRPASIYHGAGTLVRVVVGTDTNTLPQITALVDSWQESTDALGAVGWVDITAIETTALLGQVNDPATAPLGAGDTIAARVARITAAADWQFPTTITVAAPADTWTLQATTLADDLLTELYRTVDSLALTTYTGQHGDLVVADRIGAPVASLRTIDAGGGGDVPIVADSLQLRTDDERLIAAVSVARTGGTVTTYRNDGIAGRYQQRTTRRFDLVTNDPGGNADLARYAASILDRSDETYRPESFELDSTLGDPVWQWLAAAHLRTVVDVVTPDVEFVDYQVCQLDHSIEPLTPAAVHWTCTVSIDIEASSTWSTT